MMYPMVNMIAATAGAMDLSEAAVGEALERRVDGARARPPDPSGPFGDPAGKGVTIYTAVPFQGGQRIQPNQSCWHGSPVLDR